MGMSSYAIFSGLLSGLGGAAGAIGTGMAEQQKREQAEQLERDRLAQQNAQHTAALAQADAHFKATQTANRLDLSALPPALRTQLDPEGMGGQMDARLLPYVVAKVDAEAKRQDEAAKLGRETTSRLGQAAELERMGAGRPAMPGIEPPDEGAMYSAGTPATPEVAANPRLQQYAALLKYGPLGEVLAKALEGEAPKFGHAPPGSALTKDGVVTGMVPAAPKEQGTNTHIVQTAQGQMAITVDANGKEVGRVRVGDLPPHAPKEPPQPTATVTIQQLTLAKQALLGQGVPKTDPRILNLDEQINNQKSYVVGGSLVGATGDTRATPPPLPTGGERSDMADMRAALGGVDSLLKDVEANKAVLGNFASNPAGATRRGLSEYIPSMTSASEKKFLANLENQVGAIRRETLGLTQTDRELKNLVDLLPARGQVDINVIPRLQAIRDHMQRKLSERQAPFQGSTPKVLQYDAQGNRLQ